MMNKFEQFSQPLHSLLMNLTSDMSFNHSFTDNYNQLPQNFGETFKIITMLSHSVSLMSNRIILFMILKTYIYFAFKVNSVISLTLSFHCHVDNSHFHKSISMTQIQ